MSGGSGSSDDDVLEEWFRQLKSDETAKATLARAVRAKEASAIEVAVQWVVANVIKPAADAWNQAVKWLRDRFAR